MKQKKVDIIIAGVGGQGTILAGRILSTVALLEGLEVKMAETHGMAQRGGSVITHVRMGEKVFSPLIPRGDADFIMAFERLEALRWLPFLSPQGAAVVNSQVQEPLPVLTGKQEYPEGVLEEIKEKASQSLVVDVLEQEPVRGNPRTLNVFLIGMMARQMPFARETWEKSLAEVIPTRLLEVNREAFAAGYSYTA